MNKSDLYKNKFVLGTAGVFAGIIGIWGIVKISKPAVRKVCMSILQENGENEDFLDDRRITVVEAFKTKAGTMSKRVKTMGRLVANHAVLLKSETQGTVQSIPFKEGEGVKEGDVLIQFNDDAVRAELKTAEAEYDLTKADYERKKALNENRVTSSSEYQKAHAQFKIAEGKLEGLRARLQKMAIVAPVSGIAGIIESGIGIGSYVQPGTELLTVVNNNPMYVEFKVPEKYLADIGSGQMAEVTIDGLPNKTFWATVEAIDSKIDAPSRSIRVKGSIPNDEDVLRSGQFARVALVIGEKNDAIVIPENAVQRLGEREYVWIIQNGVTKQRAILTGSYENGMVEAEAGLTKDMLVVTSGPVHLRPDMPVKIKNLNELEKSEPNKNAKEDKAQSVDKKPVKEK